MRASRHRRMADGGPGGRATVLLVAAALLIGPGVFDAPTQAATSTNEPAPTVLRHVGTAGTAPPAPADLLTPSGLAVAPGGDVYVADTGTNRIVHYRADGSYIGAWGDRAASSAPGQFNQPVALDVGPSGDVYVLDQGNSRVQRFTASGQFVSAWGAPGTGDGQFTTPLALAVGADGDVWVTDSTCRVQRFVASGAFVSGWGSCNAGTAPFQAAAIAIAPDSTLYLGSQDRLGSTPTTVHVSADGQLLLGTISGAASDLEVAPDGSLYTVSSSSGSPWVRHLTAAGASIASWGTSGVGDGQFECPHGLGLAANGDVYVADGGCTPWGSTYPHLIQRLTSSGVFVEGWAPQGDGYARFLGPRDVATRPGGGMYVADSGNQRIVELDAGSTYVRSWGTAGAGAGQFSTPESLAVADDGEVYVADTGNNRVQRFTADGQFLGQWGSTGSGPGQFNQPAGIDVDDRGDVWVADRANHRVQRFDATGAYEATLGTWGNNGGQFQSPTAVAVSSEGVFVADSIHRSIERFGLDGTFATEWRLSSALAPYITTVGVATDPHGGVWVVTRGTNARPSSLTRYDAHGSLLATVSAIPSDSAGVDVAAGRRVFVAQGSNHLTVYAAAVGPLLAVTLTPGSSAVEVSHQIDYTLEVQNTGDQPLTGLHASYTGTPECDGPVADLAPGARTNLTCSHPVARSDVGTLANRVSVTSDETPGPVSSDAADVAVTVPAPVPIGQLGGASGLGHLQYPSDLAIGPGGELDVANVTGGGSSEIDAYRAGQPQGAVSLGHADMRALAVDANGDFLVTQNVLHTYPGGYGGVQAQVARFSPSGASLGLVSQTPRDGGGVGVGVRASNRDVLLSTRMGTVTYCLYDATCDCQIDPCGHYDYGSNTVYNLTGSGTGGSGVGGGPIAVEGDGLYAVTNNGTQVSTPSGSLAVGSQARDVDVDASGNIYVAFGSSDFYGTGMVRVYSPSGAEIANWEVPRAARIAVGFDGVIYVLDDNAHVVRMFGFGISGVVADEVSDAPISGAVAVAVDSAGHVAGAATSGVDGSYRLQVRSGQYRVVFVDPSGAHLGEWAWGHPVGDPTSAAAVTVGPTGQTVDIGLLAARGSVSGSVTADGSGSPVAGAWVAAIGQGSGALRGTVAAADGSYSLAGVDPGRQMVAFVDPSGQRRFEFWDDRLFAPFADAVNVAAGAVSPASASLAAQGPLAGGASISGTVTDDDAGDAPIGAAWVVAVRSDGVVRAGAVSDGSGHYALSVGPGNYRLEVVDPGGTHVGQWVWDHGLDRYDDAVVFTVNSGDAITVNAGLSSNRGTIGGQVTHGASALVGATVLAVRLSSGQVAGAATVGGDGSYSISGLVPGQYLVAFVDPAGAYGFEYFDNTTNPGAATPITVTAGHRTIADAALP